MGHSDLGISRAEVVFIVSEAICILFYGLFTEFDEYDTQKVLATNEATADQIAWTRYACF